MKKKTLVLGASTNPSRYSYLAVNRLLESGHDVVAIGKNSGDVFGIPIQTEQKLYDDIDTVTLYLNSDNQKEYYDYILKLHPLRVIFNPGTENIELEKLLHEHQIATENACTLVLLGTNQY